MHRVLNPGQTALLEGRTAIRASFSFLGRQTLLDPEGQLAQFVLEGREICQ